MADSIHGNGLFAVHDALARLADNTALLDRALRRFGGEADELPPPYQSLSNNSGTSTQPESPRQPAPEPDEERARLIIRKVRLAEVHQRSVPRRQFKQQSWRLAERLAMLRFGEREPQQAFPPPQTNDRSSLVYEQLPKAEGIIRARWQEQGIWSEEWKESPPDAALWLHEDAESAEPRRPKPRRTRATEAAAAAAASRPYSQFVYQVAKERDLLLGLVDDLDQPPLPPRKPWMMRTVYPGDPIRSSSAERADDAAYERRRLRSLVPPVPPPLKKAPADVHSTAYETVKATWVQSGIWDSRWTMLPGLQWLHEEPFDRFMRRRVAEEDGEVWNEDEEEEHDDDAGEEDNETTESPPPSQPPQHDATAPQASDNFISLPGNEPTAPDGPSLPPASKRQRDLEDEEGLARPAKRVHTAAVSTIGASLEDDGNEEVAESSTAALKTADRANQPP